MIAVFAANFLITLGATSAWALQRARTERSERHVEHLTDELERFNDELVLTNLRRIPVTRNCPEAER